jgi:hypothetical protein
MLTGEIMTLRAAGDGAAARALIEQYGMGLVARFARGAD